MTKVLHVVPRLMPYGLERVVASLSKLAERSAYQVSVASLYGAEEGSLAETLERQGIEVFRLGKRPGLDMRMPARFRKVLLRVRPHVVHTHNFVLRYTLAPALSARVPVQIHTIHNVADKEVDRFGLWIQRWAFRGAVHPVAIAQEVADSYRRVYGRPCPHLIPNGIAVEEYRRPSVPRAEFRLRNGWANDDLLFVCVARFFPQKNHRLLLEAFAAGPATLPQAKLLLVGDGALRPLLEALAGELGIAAKVTFLGRRNDVPDLLGAADIFVLASSWEGNPLSVMEAMAAGLPVLATGVGGVRELIDSGTHGLVVPPQNRAALAGRMMELAGDANARRAMGSNAAARAGERFDHAQMVRAYERLYAELLHLADGPAVQPHHEVIA